MVDNKSISSYLSAKAPLTSRSRTSLGTARLKGGSRRSISSAHGGQRQDVPPLPLPDHILQNTKDTTAKTFLGKTTEIYETRSQQDIPKIQSGNESRKASARVVNTTGSVRSGVSTSSSSRSSQMPAAVHIPSKPLMKDPRALPITINKYRDLYEYATNSSDQVSFAAIRARRADHYLAKQHKSYKKLDQYQSEWDEIKRLTKIQRNKERLAQGGEVDNEEEDDDASATMPNQKDYIASHLGKGHKAYMKKYDSELPVGGKWEYKKPRKPLHAVKSFAPIKWTLKYKPPVIKLPDDKKNTDNDGEIQYDEDGEEIDNYDIPVDFGRLRLGEVDTKGTTSDPAQQALRKLHKKMALVIGQLTDVNKDLKRVNIARETDYETIKKRERRRRKVPAHIRMAREGKAIAEDRGKKYQKYTDIKGTNQGGKGGKPFIPPGLDALQYHHEEGNKVERLKRYVNYTTTIIPPEHCVQK